MEQQNLLEPYEGYKETQMELLAIYHKKRRNNLLITGLMFLIADCIAMAVRGNADSYTILGSILFPLLYTGLAFLSLKNELAAVIGAVILVILYFVLTVIISGPAALFSGWIFKAVLVYLHISSYGQGLLLCWYFIMSGPEPLLIEKPKLKLTIKS
ncbi:MAG: hypothetical protein K2X48_02965 [Chitinophagaceae bacterium]|nr:hypothetical protein [Chitinophagaceae bacterium]